MGVAENDLIDLARKFPFKKELSGKKILITGGTGLIGSLTIKFLCLLNSVYSLGSKVYATARNKEKALTIAGENEVEWIIGNLSDEVKIDAVDFIIHTACPTQSAFLAQHPVEVINDTVMGAKNIFELAKSSKARVVYLSSMEIYGQIFEHKKIKENDYGYINHLNPRSCYPESKRLIEALTASYAFEYGVEIMNARLTQTLGAGIAKNDNRVFAQFARAAINGENIVLHTEGKSAKSYVYTTDAINALFYILFKGEKGTAYNIANETSYISIYDLACFVKDKFNNAIEVVKEIDISKGYAPDTLADLDTTRLKQLGWKATVDLEEMFCRLINYLKE